MTDQVGSTEIYIYDWPPVLLQYGDVSVRWLAPLTDRQALVAAEQLFATRYVGSVMLDGEALVFHVFTEEPNQ